jgi:hypothetical protein
VRCVWSSHGYDRARRGDSRGFHDLENRVQIQSGLALHVA